MRSDTAVFRMNGPAFTLTTTDANSVRMSAGFGPNVQHARITVTGAPAWVLIGDATVTAAPNTGVALLAGQSEIFRVTQGQRVAIIRIGATDATAYISELCY